ncbi:TIGR01440 family protein [Bacillus sp. FJAT-45350]|uniref:TIGR01440 family protein n=1 Tax=Bacillus sp. FJAT-45350 TaxID=2011014 RepID=UPI000BB6DCA5|nr:TIGR01440 family protein [Bacillus sp. FJAT-45350]
MNRLIEGIKTQLNQVLQDLNQAMPLSDQHLLVLGTSTSEVVGEHIGSKGSAEIAEALFSIFKLFQQQTGVQLAFQCCEHLNRALVIERSTARKFGYEEVTVIPVKEAGGSMSTYAYQRFDNPVVVESIKADAGIDIGDTFIGMHLKHVAVPVRSKTKMIGSAHVTLAKTRPKLIGGNRAVYPELAEHEKCD